MRRLMPLCLLVPLFTSGCDHSSKQIPTMPDQVAVPLRLASPDLSFKLAPADRANLRRGIHADALERLLAMVHPDRRKDLLVYFKWPAPGEPVRGLTQLGDPVLQEALDEVWLPFWEAHPEALEDKEQDADRPGRQLAKLKLRQPLEHR